MSNKLIYRLLLVLSVFALSPSQQVFAADTAIEPAEAVVVMSDKININTASAEQFATINGIGAKKAQAIIDYRQEHGEFVSLNDLINVKGIGPGTLKKIEPFLML